MWYKIASVCQSICPNFAEAISPQLLHQFTPNSNFIEVFQCVGVCCYIYSSMRQVMGCPWASERADQARMLAVFFSKYKSGVFLWIFKTLTLLHSRLLSGMSSSAAVAFDLLVGEKFHWSVMLWILAACQLGEMDWSVVLAWCLNCRTCISLESVILC